MLCSQSLLVQSAMMAMTQQASPASDSEAHSSGRATGEQADGSELRAEYEARLAVAAAQAEQVVQLLWHEHQHWSSRQSFGLMRWTGKHDSLGCFCASKANQR